MTTAADDSVQHHFAAQKDNLLSSWTDSELRRFLLSKGVVSPHSKREELVLLAEQYGADSKDGFADATHSVASAASHASSAVSSAASAAASSVSDNAQAAYYAATNAPSLAYDTAAEKLQGRFSPGPPCCSLARWLICLPLTDGRDYVYSTWTDSDLRNFLVDKGLLKTNAQAKRDEMLDMIRQPYNDAANNVYDTWSDNFIVSRRRQHERKCN